MLKTASVYNCILPTKEELDAHLSGHEYDDIGMHQLASTGFVPVEGEDFVSESEGWMRFKLRHDTKIIPSASVREELDKRIEQIEQDESRTVRRKERLGVKDEIIMEFCTRALVKRQHLTGYYHTESETLIVDTASDSMSDMFTGALLRAVGTIKATTIYINGIVGDLSRRLLRHIREDGGAFGNLTPSGKCKLTKATEDGKETITFSGADNLSMSEIATLIDEEGFAVSQLGFTDDVLTFDIDSKFKFRAIRNIAFMPDETDDESYSPKEHELKVTLHVIRKNIEHLCALFEYKRPEVIGEEVTHG